ncbi:MAG: hypothetical protein ACE141_16740, partial [Bryobacteraceae bacterium]
MTNAHLADESNPHVTFWAAGGYSVHTRPQADADAERLTQFFPERRIVPLGEVLATEVPMGVQPAEVGAPAAEDR